MFEGYTATRFSADEAKNVNVKVNGNSTNPFQENKEFKMATNKPYGLVTSKDGKKKFAIVYLLDSTGKEVELWLNTLTKTVLNDEEKTVVASEYKFNQDFTARVLGHDDNQTWWNAFTDLVGDKTLVCHRQSVWVKDKRFIIIGFDLK